MAISRKTRFLKLAENLQLNLGDVGEGAMLAHVVVQLGGVAGVHQRAAVRDLENDTGLLTFKQVTRTLLETLRVRLLESLRIVRPSSTTVRLSSVFLKPFIKIWVTSATFVQKKY